MTEKRFNYIAFDGFEDNGEYITPYHVCELLNELHEENQLLKLQVETKLFSRRELEKENKQLKSRCNDYDKALKTLQDLTDRKLKENEQLKHELLCKQLDKAPTEPINCKCHYEVKE